MVNSQFVEMKFASAKIVGMTMEDQAKMFLVTHQTFVGLCTVITTVYGALLVMLTPKCYDKCGFPYLVLAD